MSSTTTILQLDDRSQNTNSRGLSYHTRGTSFPEGRTTTNAYRDTDPPATAIDSIPDGGYGWTVVSACAVFLFWTNGWASTWGVLSAAMVRSSYLEVSASTISFVGSLALSLYVAFGLLAVRLFKLFGTRKTCVVGAIMLGSGTILTSFTLDNLGGLFCTAGVLVGLGSCTLYTASNSIPVQWFSGRLGLANGLIKAGGGVGATVIALAAQGLIDSVGLPWTFRIFGGIMLATGIPCALLLRERGSTEQASRIDWDAFKNVPFICLCIAGAISTFALYIPPFLLPLFSESIGLSPSTGATLVAGFALSSTIGRLVAGYSCDRIGSMNTLLITMFTNAVSVLAIWTVSNSLAPLTVFAVINGVANGSFFSVFPTGVAAMVPGDPALASTAMSVATSLWSIGYFLGAPIAGLLVQNAGKSSIRPYGPAIFYAGGVALSGSLLVLASRVKMEKRLMKKL